MKSLLAWLGITAMAWAFAMTVSVIILYIAAFVSWSVAPVDYMATSGFAVWTRMLAAMSGVVSLIVIINNP